MTLDELHHAKIAVLGMGVNNLHLAGYLKKHGIVFSVIEKWQSPDELAGRLDEFEIIFRTPGLPYLSAVIQDAKKRGAQIYSQTKLFFDLCPARIIGITGTKGKGTTATLIAKMLEVAGHKTYLAGNIGSDPFEFIDNLKADEWVVLELSSFQLQDLHKSPHVAVVLKITPEHLDHHESFEEYVSAKLPIIKFQTPEDKNVINYDSEISRSFADKSRGFGFWNSTERSVQPGCFVADGKIVFNHPAAVIMEVSEVGLLGRFNLENVTAAIAAAFAAGVNDFSLMREVIMAFKGLPHRLEFVAEIKGVKFYDDSFSTTPETAMAALSAFDAPIILIAGGSEKNSDYSQLAKKIATSKIKALLAIGSTGPTIAKLSREAGYNGKIYEENLADMQAIVGKANEIAEKGDIVLLSPAAASFDMFTNYKHRGELFKKYVDKLRT